MANKIGIPKQLALEQAKREKNGVSAYFDQTFFEI